MKKKGAELVVEVLKHENVDVLFGYPGGSVIPLFDALYSEPSLHVVLTRHEQAAVHAADGYARSTGKVGVCVATSGPGATNTVTGLATANFDSIPIVCITGQVSRYLIGNNAFQEADTVGITLPISKHNFLVTDRNDLGRILKEAFYIARSGRPGPVVVDIPKDVLYEIGETDYPEEVSIRGYNPTYKGHPLQIEKAAKLLNKAEKPVLFIGGGVIISGASDALGAVIEKTKIPVVSSLLGIGALRHDHPYYLGMLGMHGTYAANMAVTNCDVLCAIGVRFDDRATGDVKKFAPHAKIIHMDIDPAEVDHNVKVDIPVVGDARLILEDMLPHLKEPDITAWRTQVVSWAKEHPLYHEEFEGFLSPTKVIEELCAFFPDAIITSEVGQNQMWAAHFFNFQRPRTWITSGGLGTMGFGFPAALGVQIGNPSKRVIDIAGDGSIQMNIQELATAMQEKLPVIVAILNNGYLGMVRQWQEIFHDRRYSKTCLKYFKGCPEVCNTPGAHCPDHYFPDFVKLAEAYGAVGIRVEKPEEIRPALETAKKTLDRPVFIDFIVAREANVYPIVPPGAGIYEMILGRNK